MCECKVYCIMCKYLQHCERECVGLCVTQDPAWTGECCARNQDRGQPKGAGRCTRSHRIAFRR